MAALGQKACEVVAFEMLQEPLDRVEVGALGRQIERLEVMPVQPLRFVPTRVVQQEDHLLSRGRRDFDGHGVQERERPETICFVCKTHSG